MVLTAEKGVALLIMDNDMYIVKYMALQNYEEFYKEYIDQTKSIYSSVVKQLLNTKFIWTHIGTTNYPLDDNSPLHIFMGSLNAKVNIPFQTIISACGTFTYRLTKFLTIILQQHYGNNFLFVKDNKGLV